MLTVERIKSIQASLHAEDVDVDWVVMLSWSEADVRAYFERGGQAEAPALPSQQEWRSALDGDGDNCAAPSGAHAAPSSEPQGPPQHKRFMRPADFTNSPAPTQAERREGYLPGVHAPRSAADDAREDAEKQRGHEPPPPLPGGSGVMSVEEAYDFLGVASEDRGDLNKVKARFRKMCLKWHPDKNRGRERQAAEVFQAATAAYHFLTTRNFDYKRWKDSFTIPPMQSLDEVLLMALSGEDPYRIEELLRRRGEYRPHRDFGVNLSIPWNAGHSDDPSYDVAHGSAYSTTRKLEDGSAADERPRELGLTQGADDDAYVTAMEDLVARGADLGKLRRLAHVDSSGADLRNELKRLGYARLGERARAISALKAASAGRVARASQPATYAGGGGGATSDGGGGCSHAISTVAGEAALLNELSVVEAPRVRELGLYESHNEAYLQRFGKQAELGANDDKRPWEATALGRELKGAQRAPYVRATTYTSISPEHARSAELAEKANEQAMVGFREKNYQLCFDAAGEAIRLQPQKVAYYGNRAAAALKLRGQSHLRQAVEDCRVACSLDPTYVKGYVRSAEAHFAMGEPHTVKIAVEMYESALQLEPTNRTIVHALEHVRMIYQSDYTS